MFGKFNINLRAQNKLPEWGLLHEAALRNKPEPVKRLLFRGCYFVQIGDHPTPLLIAKQKVHLEIADQLLTAPEDTTSRRSVRIMGSYHS